MAEYTHQITRQENAKVLLEITVPSEMVASSYTKTLSDVSKKAQVKGFRKGKVPLTVLEQKFGDAIKAESAEHIIQDAVKAVLEKIEVKPINYSMPQLEIDENNDQNIFLVDKNKDFVFTISYDTIPHIEIGDVSKLTLDEIDVKISEQDLEAELRGIQERNALTVKKSEAIEQNDIVTYDFVELDEQGEEIASTKRESYTATIGQNQSLYELDSDIIGMKIKDEKIVEKTFPEDYTYEEMAGKTYRIKINISDVKTKDLPEIDDELAKDVNEKYNTLDDLKTHLSLQLKDRADYIIEEINRNKIIEHLITNSKIEVPQSAVALQQESLWKQFAQQYGGEESIMAQIQNSGNSKEKLLDMWKHDAFVQVREQLLVNKLLENEAEISDEDVENKLKEDCERSNQDYQEILSYYKDQNLFPQIKYDMQQKKLFENLSKNTIINKKGKTISFTELLEFKQSLEKKAEEHDTPKDK